MIKKIALLLMLATFAFGQYVPVQYGTNDQTIIYGGVNGSSTNIIGYASGMFAPSYGSLYEAVSPITLAGGVTVTNGTITTGTVASLQIVDQDYFTVQETGAFVIDIAFTNSMANGFPEIFDLVGYYDGNPAHDVKFSIKDQTTGTYSNFTAETTDMQSGTTVEVLRFNVPTPKANFSTNGVVDIRITHSAAAVSSHYIYIDYVDLTFASLIAVNAGEWYPMTMFDVQQSNNIAIDGSAGTITTTSAGDYEWKWYASFIGATSTVYNIRHLTNGTPTSARSIRTINGVSQVGSMSAFGGGRLAAGTTNSWQISSSTDDAWIAIITGAAKVTKLSN